jgi:hypothetical protein
LLVHFSGYAPSLAVKDPAQRLSRILPFGAKRQFVLSYQPVTFSLHAVFDEFMFVAAGAFGLHSQALIQFVYALSAVLKTLVETLALLVEVFCATGTQTQQNNEQDTSPTSHCTTPFGIQYSTRQRPINCRSATLQSLNLFFKIQSRL